MANGKHLNGTVREGNKSGTALTGATVEIADKKATTGGTGAFRIADAPAGVHELVISKEGYVTQAAGHVVSDEEERLMRFHAPVPPFTCSGVILDGSVIGPGCVGATVAIGSHQATTNVKGEFGITGIPTGSYTLNISKPGYIPQTTTGFVVNGNVSGLTFVLVTAAPIYYTLSGIVRSASGPPLQGAEVNIAGKTSTTDQSGTFSITGIVADRMYALGVFKKGYLTQVLTHYTVNCDQHGLVFTLAPSPACSLSGFILDGGLSGPGCAGAEVEIAGLTATSDDNGEFLITGLATGSYTLVISKPGYASQTITDYIINGDQGGLLFALSAATAPLYSMSGTVRSTSGQTLDGVQLAIDGKNVVTDSAGGFSIAGIPAGIYPLTIAKSGYQTNCYPHYVVNDDQQGLLFSLFPSPPYSISGRVSDRFPYGAGPGCEGATVAIAGLSAITNDDGTFGISGLAAGAYTLTISKPGYTTQTLAGYVINGDQSDLFFVLATTAPLYYGIHGTVRSATSGHGLDGAEVSVAGKTALTDVAGQYSITGIESGIYALGVSKPGYAWVTQTRFYVNSDEYGQDFNLTPSPSYSMHGKVMLGSPGGAGCAGATVTIADMSATTTSAGEFSITGLAAGTYTFSISKTGCIGETIQGYVISGDQNGLVFVLQAAPPVSLSGKVLNGSMAGRPLWGVTVTCAGKTVVTDKTGRYNLTGLTVGTYVLIMSKPKYQSLIKTMYTVDHDMSGLVDFLVPSL